MPVPHRGLAEHYRRFDLVIVVLIVIEVVAIALQRSRSGQLSMSVGPIVITAALS